MPKKDLKTALGSSLHVEEDAVAARVAKADTYFGSEHKRPGPPPAEHARDAQDRVVRDGFTMPAADYGLIAQLQARLLEAGHSANKSELLRAGLHALEDLPPGELVRVLEALGKVKTGRPAKE